MNVSNRIAALRGTALVALAASNPALAAFRFAPKPAVGVSGNWGWQFGSYTVKYRSGRVVETSKYLSVSEKKGDKWLYVRETWSADASAPAPAAAPHPVAPAKK